MRKLLTAGLAVICAVCFAGCSGAEDKAGGALIKQAREEYTSLDSARVVMTDMSTGEEAQSFTFKYDEKDTLVYSYYGKSANSEYAQYNNGLESFTYENGKVSHMSKGDADFVRYTRKLPHPQADAGLLIYSPENITEAKEETVPDGIKVTHVYDVQKIGAKVEEGTVTGFRAEYLFDSDGKLMYFDEITEAENSGSEMTYDYRVEITEKNGVSLVENTVEQFMKE